MPRRPLAAPPSFTTSTRPMNEPAREPHTNAVPVSPESGEGHMNATGSTSRSSTVYKTWHRSTRAAIGLLGVALGCGGAADGPQATQTSESRACAPKSTCTIACTAGPCPSVPCSGEPSSHDAAYRSRCTRTVLECGADPDVDAVCTVAARAYATTSERFEDCLAKECSAMPGCLRAALLADCQR